MPDPAGTSEPSASPDLRARDFDSRGAWAVLWIGIAAAYAATGFMCARLSGVVANVSWMLYIPAGLSLTASLMWGSRVWPAVFVGELVMCLATGEAFSAGLIMACGNGLDAALTGWWFHDRLGRRIELDRIREVVQLLAAELLLLQPLSAAIGMAALLATGQMPAHRLTASAVAWYSANSFTPSSSRRPTAIAPGCAGRGRRRRGPEYFELARAWPPSTLLVGAIGPGRWAVRPLPLPVTLILVFPVLAWACIRFVPSVSLTVGTVLGVFAFDAALAGAGRFQGMRVDERMVSLNMFMIVSVGTGLILAAASANERRFESEQARLIAKLRATADQVTRLEEFVTFCAWTGQVRWKDRWVSVEHFLVERYGLNVTHGISESAMKLHHGRHGQPHCPPKRMLRSTRAAAPL